MSEPQEDVSTEGPVFEFEGDAISEFSAQIPSTKLEAPNAYPRGTILDLRLQVRVRSVRLDEGRGGALSRNHILALEECEIVGVMTPGQRAAVLAQLQAQQEAEAAQAKIAETAPVIEEEEPGGEVTGGLEVDPDDPEDWASLDDEQKNELRRRAVEDGVDEFEVHEPHPVNEPVQEGPAGISTAEAGGVLRDGGLEVGVGDEEPGHPVAVDPGF